MVSRGVVAATGPTAAVPVPSTTSRATAAVSARRTTPDMRVILPRRSRHTARHGERGGDGAGLLRAIEARLPGVRLLTDPGDRESYRRDETAYLAAGLPLAVALPTATAEVV